MILVQTFNLPSQINEREPSGMPFVDITLPTGIFSVRYTIATPTSGSKSANTIEPDLPCIVFIHSGYLAQETFESKRICLYIWLIQLRFFHYPVQFSDGRLREFNLITFDMRGFGETTGDIGDTMYTPTESAYDVEQIMVRFPFLILPWDLFSTLSKSV